MSQQVKQTYTLSYLHCPKDNLLIHTYHLTYLRTCETCDNLCEKPNRIILTVHSYDTLFMDIEPNGIKMPALKHTINLSLLNAEELLHIKQSMTS